MTVLGLSSSGSGAGGRGGRGVRRGRGGSARRSGRRASAGGGEGRADITELDVGVGDGGVGFADLNVGGDTGSGGARATSNTGAAGVGGGGVVGVEPEHVDGVVVPDGENENHAGSHTLGDGGKTSLVGERWGVVEDGDLVSAVVGGDGVVRGGESGDVDVGVLNDDAVLNVDAADLAEGAGSSSVVGEELGDDGELLGGVDGHASTVEGGVAHAEGVEVAAIGVADGVVAAGGSASVVGSAVAARLGTNCAGVRSDGSGVVVGLPDIHLVTAGTVLPSAGVNIAARGIPSDRVGLE